MKSLYFVRHGESEFNRAYKWAGSSDTPLTPKGHTQAKATGKRAWEKGLKIDAIISSPLSRAIQTAEHIAAELNYPKEKIIILDKLIERSFGKLEGRKDLAATTKYLADEAAIDHYEGVESLADLHERAKEVLSYLDKLEYDNILIVGHGASGRALRRIINSEPMNIRGHSYANAELVKLI